MLSVSQNLINKNYDKLFELFGNRKVYLKTPCLEKFQQAHLLINHN